MLLTKASSVSRQTRLTRAESRLTPPLEGANFTYGFDSEQLKKVLTHWRTKYDWQKRLRSLNELPHYRTNIDGLDIHFVHVQPEVGDSGVKDWPSYVS